MSERNSLSLYLFIIPPPTLTGFSISLKIFAMFRESRDLEFARTNPTTEASVCWEEPASSDRMRAQQLPISPTGGRAYFPARPGR